ncbi:MAG: hypothetical protein MUP36_03130 [Demequinaceae bacterium]|nr:hypothetical protein [Demequinaceae bacterium]
MSTTTRQDAVVRPVEPPRILVRGSEAEARRGGPVTVEDRSVEDRSVEGTSRRADARRGTPGRVGTVTPSIVPTVCARTRCGGRESGF